MDDMNYSGTDVEYETEEEKKGFKLTRGMLIIIVLVLIAIITVVIIVIAKRPKKPAPKYSAADFEKLESRMKEEASLYVSQNFIQLNSEEYRIELKDLLYENGGSIDSSKVRAAKICEGYVIATKKYTEVYKPYIKCQDLYTTKGYKEDKKSTTKKQTTTKKDNKAPNIIIIGEKEINLTVGDTYNEQGADATDEEDGDISSKVKISGSVDTSKAGTYEITYSVSDSSGQIKEAKRIVKVQTRPVATTKQNTTHQVTTRPNVTTTTKKYVQTTKRITTPPTIRLNGSTVIKLIKGASYSEPGYSAVDANGNNITSRVSVSSNIDTSTPGTYYVKYYVTDSYGNSSSASRTIRVEDNYIALSGVTLSPSGNITMKIGTSKSFRVSFTPSNASNKNVSWATSNSYVATVSNGTVYAKSVGTAVVTVYATDNKHYSVTINVIR